MSTPLICSGRLNVTHMDVFLHLVLWSETEFAPACVTNLTWKAVVQICTIWLSKQEICHMIWFIKQYAPGPTSVKVKWALDPFKHPSSTLKFGKLSLILLTITDTCTNEAFWNWIDCFQSAMQLSDYEQLFTSLTRWRQRGECLEKAAWCWCVLNVSVGWSLAGVAIFIVFVLAVESRGIYLPQILFLRDQLTLSLLACLTDHRCLWMSGLSSFTFMKIL